MNNPNTHEIREIMGKTLKTFDNYAPKVSLVLFLLSFASFFIYKVIKLPASSVDLYHLMISSLAFASICGLLGYIGGKVYSQKAQEQHLGKLNEERVKRKKILQNHIREKEEMLKKLEGMIA